LGARAADIVRTPLPEVRPQLALSEAVRLLRESGRQVILVTTPAGMPVGALTARDVALSMAAA
jgi:CBS domain-containing protein